MAVRRGNSGDLFLLSSTMMNDWKNNLIQDTTAIQGIIRDTKTIAVLGIKPDSHPDQPAHYVPAHMLAAGFEIFPVPVY